MKEKPEDTRYVKIRTEAPGVWAKDFIQLGNGQGQNLSWEKSCKKNISLAVDLNSYGLNDKDMK